ncbi:CYFA0S20e02080g1_1 [Cyberlindnera fabianii]|uniref:CYFA0S20e02080g1_1 n=1 Tax=Cyberlindnera fabianii TaxID=36022 RepID=A0A061B983_CYBFA|nr:CYFA0S20e02080g1_1 [Cyberlindnera fabianii]
MYKSLPKARFGRHFERLNLLSSGAGSVTVPAEVKSVELIFKKRTPDGHMGPRRFWRENLPRVQFHNPELPIRVVRIEPEAGEYKKVPALLKINFRK